MVSEDSFAIFLDFDGTLVDLAQRPHLVEVPPGLCSDLVQLRDRVGGALAIVTGRPIAAIDSMLGIANLDVAGIHGAEIRLGNAHLTPISDQSERFFDVLSQLRRLSVVDRRFVIEEKCDAIALHWRTAPNLEAVLLDHLSEAAAELGPAYRVQRGKSVAEILPAHASKASAIRTLLCLPPYNDRTPIFIGDDLTDEGAFEFVNSSGGLSIRVGEGPSSAHQIVGNTAHVRLLVKEWAAGAPFWQVPFGETGRRLRPTPYPAT